MNAIQVAQLRLEDVGQIFQSRSQMDISISLQWSPVSLRRADVLPRRWSVPVAIFDLGFLAIFQIFGPVCTLHPFDSEEQVIQWHNNVPYGLAGSVWTSNLRRAHTVSQRLETGMVWVNCWLRRYVLFFCLFRYCLTDYRDLRVPFGGVKASGIGSEGGFQSLDAFSQKKNICIAFDWSRECSFS